jgi:hypothetical protein
MQLFIVGAAILHSQARSSFKRKEKKNQIKNFSLV